jgi:prophage regulatory protein
MRLPDVLAATGLARSTIYKYLEAGTFPSPLKLGGSGSGRAIGWRVEDIAGWIDGLKSARTIRGGRGR